MSKHVHIEGTGKPLKVVAQKVSNSGADLTSGKVYEVSGYWDGYDSDYGWGCIIKDDKGYSYNILECGEDDLGGGNWIVTERAAE